MDKDDRKEFKKLIQINKEIKKELIKTSDEIVNL